MRDYAPFFEWLHKDRKELGVAQELLESLNRASGARYHSPRIHRPDPPDCVCSNAAGGLVAIEVAEVVCEEAARLTAQGEKVMRVWKHGEFRAHIAGLLAAKDSKTFHGGPYSEIVASLFTDEPMLTLGQVMSELADASFGPYKQLTSAFLLLSYEPGTKSYRVFALRILQ